MKVINEGGDADAHRLRLADSAEMYAGLNRALSYCLLSLEYGTLTERATRKADVQIYQRKTDDQCIIHDLVIEIAQHPGAFYAGIAGNIAADYLGKFIKFCFDSAAGLLEGRDQERILEQYERVEPFFDSLTEKIEPHLLAVHAPIQKSETIKLKFETESIEFDKETKEFLAESSLSAESEDITGVVTRLNIVTGNGRFYSDAIGRIVPFSQTAELKAAPASKHLSWSLRERDQERAGIITVTIKRVISNTDRVKRLIVYDVTPPGR